MKNSWSKILVLALALLVSWPAAARRKETRQRVRLETSMGNITVALSDLTPRHRDNFVKLAREGYFDGLLFHRVIKDFMIQGGASDSRGAEAGAPVGERDVDYTLPAEIVYPELFHKRGALAAAREGDDVNPERRSSGAQFYIVWGRTFTPQKLAPFAASLREATDGRLQMNAEVRDAYETLGGTPHLDGAYTVFGEVVDGLKVVRAIQKVTTDRNDRPVVDVVINHAEVLSAPQP